MEKKMESNINNITIHSKCFLTETYQSTLKLERYWMGKLNPIECAKVFKEKIKAVI